MKIEKATIIVFVAVTFIFGLLTNANANLIVNGSFETGPDPEPTGVLELPSGSTLVDGWEVSPDAVDYIGTCWLASDGERSLDLDNSDGFGGIEQTFETNVDEVYLVTFDMAGNPYRGLEDPFIKYMRVSAAGDSADFSFDTEGKGYPANMGWVTHDWQFTAISDSTTLEFYSLHTFDEGYSGACGPALDNVSVSVVHAPHSPEPATVALLGLGALSLLRRKRSV